MVSLGHVCLEVPQGAGYCPSPKGGLASLSGTWCAFLVQQTLPRDTRLTSRHWGSTPRTHCYLGPSALHRPL